MVMAAQLLAHWKPLIRFVVMEQLMKARNVMTETRKTAMVVRQLAR